MMILGESPNMRLVCFDMHDLLCAVRDKTIKSEVEKNRHKMTYIDRMMVMLVIRDEQ